MVRVSAARVDQLVQLPALIRPRPPLKRLLDRCTLLGDMPFPRLRGGVFGSGGGRVRAYRHPLLALPGGFPLDTGRREAWVSHAGCSA